MQGFCFCSYSQGISSAELASSVSSAELASSVARGESCLVWYNVENLFYPENDSTAGDDEFTPRE